MTRRRPSTLLGCRRTERARFSTLAGRERPSLFPLALRRTTMVVSTSSATEACPPRHMRPSRRILTTLRGCVVGICITLAAFAEDASAPAAVQGQILVRLMLYERRFVKRAPNEVVVLLLQKAGNSDSINAVGQMQKVLRDIGVINGMPIR